MRSLITLLFALATTAIPLCVAAEEASQLHWPVFAQLNHSYSARAVSEEHGFRLEYRVSGKAVVKRVAVPAELWNRMKGDFHPQGADAVVAPSGELSSVEITEKGRELWITFDRSASTGQCLAMIYPSGRGIGDLSPKPTSECGS